jgi:type I restriction enzyme S subunit
MSPLGKLALNRDRERVPVNAKERASRLGKVPYYGASGQVGWIDAPIFEDPLLLLGEDGVQFFDADKQKAYMIDGPTWVNNHAHVLAEQDGVRLRYLMHFLNQFDYHGFANGTTRLKLTRSSMDEIPVRLAPTAEQEGIVAAIEEAFSKLDAGEAGLRIVRQLLKRMRDAVLAAAVTGRLVPQDLTDAPASELFADLGVEAIEPKNQLATLPKSWVVRRVGELLAGPLTNGRSVRTRAGGFPVLRLTCLRDGRIDLGETKEGEWDAVDAAQYVVQRGDFLVSRGNGSLDLVGRGGLVDVDPGPVAYPDTLIRVRVSDSALDPSFLAMLWNSAVVRRQLEAQARTTAGIYKVNQSMIAEVRLPIAPRHEQVRIVAEVERQFSFLDACDRAVDAGLTRAAALRRSILKAAFEGRLVPQDPTDEPASVLLERIRAERAAAPKPPRRTRRTA